MANVYVNIDELKQIAQDMKTKSNNIIDNYQNQVESAITLGQEAIQISGLDTTQIKSSFNKIFTNLNTRINELADFLINNVANEYDDISLAITNSFNDSFATELAGLLGITVGTGTVTKTYGSGSKSSEKTAEQVKRETTVNEWKKEIEQKTKEYEQSMTKEERYTKAPYDNAKVQATQDVLNEKLKSGEADSILGGINQSTKNSPSFTDYFYKKAQDDAKQEITNILSNLNGSGNGK